jgi:predicted DNA-binding helix-hairpin-helix protein
MGITIKRSLDPYQKLEVLGEAATHDIDLSKYIYPAATPRGRVPVLKILMDNQCKNNCLYCGSCSSLNSRECCFEPEELARTFIEMKSRGLVQGLFLSSAIRTTPDATMERMISALEIIRLKYGFQGYIHLKIMPLASLSYVERAADLANRISVNLEVPTEHHLGKICPDKDFQAFLSQMKKMAKLTGEKDMLSQTTQFVVGASDESDGEILKTCEKLYSTFNLRRIYFEAFRPIPNTPLEDHPPTPKIRQDRLYQADFLLKRYGFSSPELIFKEDGNLDPHFDPKLTWALHHPENFPLEINKASFRELVRIPGIGPKRAQNILELRRREGRIGSESMLKLCGVPVKRAAPFILVSGKRLTHNPDKDVNYSLSLKYP